MPLKPDKDCIKIIRETIVAGKHFLQKKLKNIRIYITAMKIKHFDMSSEMLQVHIIYMYVFVLFKSSIIKFIS